METARPEQFDHEELCEKEKSIQELRSYRCRDWLEASGGYRTLVDPVTEEPIAEAIDGWNRFGRNDSLRAAEGRYSFPGNDRPTL